MACCVAVVCGAHREGGVWECGGEGREEEGDGELHFEWWVCRLPRRWGGGLVVWYGSKECVVVVAIGMSESMCLGWKMDSL